MMTETEWCAVSALHSSPLNPAGRTTASALKGLRKSIEERGILVPLLVTDDGEVIDGHRRLQCAKTLGITAVAVVRVTPDPALWSEMAETTRTTRPHDFLHIYLKGGKITSPTVKNRIAALEQIGGRALLRRLYDAGLSHSIYSLSLLVTHYVGQEAKDFEWMSILLDWLITGRRQFLVRSATRQGIPPAILYEAIVEGRDVKQKWE